MTGEQVKVATVLGARPQFIKAAPVSRAMQVAGIVEVLIHTGQHYDESMSAVFFDELEIPEPMYHLGVGSGAHGLQTARMLEGVEEVLQGLAPDAVLVYGDTNSTLAGALAAAKLHIPVCHVEAGLRSFNRRMPEELNRVLADHLSDLLFAPTQTAMAHLRREGIPESRLCLTGDVMYDSALLFAGVAASKSTVLTRLDLAPRSYCLATVHRAENTDDRERLWAILDGLDLVGLELPVVLPLHPRTRACLEDTRSGLRMPTHVRLVDAVGYLDMVTLEGNAAVIATDSGGIQKEAFFYRVPCVTLRHETEWVESIELGWNRLAPPTSPKRVHDAVLGAVGTTGREGRPYGNGDAAKVIVTKLEDELQ